MVVYSRAPWVYGVYITSVEMCFIWCIYYYVTSVYGVYITSVEMCFHMYYFSDS